MPKHGGEQEVNTHNAHVLSVTFHLLPDNEEGPQSLTSSRQTPEQTSGRKDGTKDAQCSVFYYFSHRNAADSTVIVAMT